MRNILLVVGAAGLVGIFSACGGDDKAPVASDGVSGKTSGGKSSGGKGSGGKTSVGGQGGEGGAPDLSSGGSQGGGSSGQGGTLMGQGGEAGAGGEGGAAVATGTPPAVSILSPEEVIDPLGGKVLVKDTVDVTCKAVPGEGPEASAVDPTTVKIAVLASDGTTVVSEKDAIASGVDEYTAAIPLTGVTTGKVILRCSARSITKALGTDAVDTLADRGPTITLIEPIPNAKLALKEPLKISFTATPTPLTATGDTQADVADVVLTLNGVDVQTSPKGDGAYEATVAMDGPGFIPKPNGATAIAVTARNKRSPDPASSTTSSSVFVDGAGPAITVTAPQPATIVGGTVIVSFTVTDAGSGVNPDSIVVSYDTTDTQFANSADWTHSGDNFTFKFDSRKLSNSLVQIPIKITAQDNVGNATSSASVPVYLDNVGPQVDIDPANVRTADIDGNCSVSFDPVGSDNKNDLESGSGLDFMRVMVWDRTNRKIGSAAPLHLAGARQSSVQLFFRNPADPKTLLVNTKAPGTGACDDIQDSGVQSESINLTALTPTTTAWYNAESVAAPTLGCGQFPGGSKPQTLCGGDSSLWQLIGQFESDAKEPAIYAFSPTGGSECTGQGWGYDSLVDADGWVCFAARAVDRVGNVGISPPLRLCIDSDPTDQVKPACSTGLNPPKCTDGCTAPTRGGGFVLDLQ
ncbi:MAG: hypothetical protein ABUL60_05295 [Myxococcales bacterium]